MNAISQLYEMQFSHFSRALLRSLLCPKDGEDRICHDSWDAEVFFLFLPFDVDASLSSFAYTSYSTCKSWVQILLC